MWFPFLLFSFIGISLFIRALNNLPWLGPLLILLVLLVIGAFLSPLILEAFEKHTQRLARVKRQRELDSIPKLWKEAQFPTPECFLSDLYTAYFKIRCCRGTQERILHRPYLAQLAAIFQNIYKQSFPETLPSSDDWYLLRTRNANEAYQLLLDTFVQSLVNLTEYIAYECTETQQPEPPTLFTLQTKLCDVVIVSDGAKNPEWTWKPRQLAAFQAFLEPYQQNRAALDKYGLLPRDLNIYVDADKPYRFEYENEEKFYSAFDKYDTVRARALKSLPAFQAPFYNTPFFTIAQQLFPYQTANLPFPIPPELWFSSTWVCAPQGKGKTNLLHNIIKDRRTHGTVILMDAKGELIGPYLDTAIVIEPSLTNPPQINPLDIGSSIHAIELLEYLLSALLEAAMTPKQSTLFSGVLTLLVTIPNATVETLRQVFAHGWKPYEQYVNALPKRDREFFTAGNFDSKGYTATKEEVLWRLQLLFRNPYMAAMLEAPRTRLDMGKLMDSGRIIVINNNPDILGDLGAEFFGRFMLALVWNAVRARANSGSKYPVFFIIDEAQTVISRDDNIPKLIHQCRSQNVALIFSHQELSYIKSEDVKNALGNCAIKFAAPDAEISILAPRFRTTPEFLASLPPYHFAACIRDKETVAVTVPDLAMQTQPRPKPQPPTKSENFDLEWEITISPKMALEGGEVKVEHLTVTIPPNTKHKDTLRIRSHGAPKPDGTRGDLYLTVNVPRRSDQRAIPKGPEEIG